MPIHLRALAQRAVPGAVVVAARPLAGGVSARVTALTLHTAAGPPRQVVVREYGPRDRRANPQVAAQEFALLTFLRTRGLPVPEPLWHEPGVLVQGFMEGHSGVEVGADPASLARFLARLHALRPGDVALPTLPEVPPPTDPPDDSLSESRIRAALVEHPPKSIRTSLLHGDLWPGNTLWQSGTLSAVLDWEDAALGDPLADVGNTRLELLFVQGEDAMQAFTRAYAEASGTDLGRLPSWDLRAALRPCGKLHTWGLEPAQERTMRERHAGFVAQALTGLKLR